MRVFSFIDIFDSRYFCLLRMRTLDVPQSSLLLWTSSREEEKKLARYLTTNMLISYGMVAAVPYTLYNSCVHAFMRSLCAVQFMRSCVRYAFVMRYVRSCVHYAFTMRFHACILTRARKCYRVYM